MTRYDDEKIIIQDFQDYNTRVMLVIPEDVKTIRIMNSIHDTSEWSNWVDSSSKTQLPPDFYNDKLRLMMDVMRIDDHSYIDEKGNPINPYIKRESEIMEELINKDEMFKKVAEKGNLFINQNTGLSTDEDHNYTFYIEGFKRVISKHIKKIKDYKKNHPGYKVIFFVLDEAAPYIKCFDERRLRYVGEGIYAQPHFWWKDWNMLKVLEKSGVDYLIWMTPYKHFESKEKVELPCVVILDVKKINYDNLFFYKPTEMQSLEM